MTLVRKYVCSKALPPILGVMIFFSLFFLAGPTKLFQIIFLSLFHVEACNFFFVAAILKTCCHCYRKNKNG